MKKLLLASLIGFFVVKSQAQQTKVSSQKVNIDYLKKSKIQGRTGLYLLGGGALLYGLGSFQLAHATDKNGYGAFLMLGGTAMAAGSIPFLILSASSLHRAKLEMKRDVFMISPGKQGKIAYTSFILHFDL